MWDKKKAIDYLNAHANATSLGRCAEFVRKALEAGGITLHRRTSAKDYGISLQASGFISAGASTPLAGDVAIIQPIHGHPHGHMTMFNGEIWISDFKQYHGLYPGPAYRQSKPSFVIYRYSN